MYSGGFYPFPTPEEFWAYWSRYIQINRYQDAPKPVYQDLRKLVAEKDYFIITTNVDHCFQKAGFDKHRLFYTQGDYGLWQCSKPCHQETYDNEETVRKMFAEQRDMRIPTELVPRCPRCGRPMAMNLRCDDTFVQDAGWYAAARRYEDFLRRHRGRRLLFLELGVGGNTPGIIKYPFWKMTLDSETTHPAGALRPSPTRGGALKSLLAGDPCVNGTEVRKTRWGLHGKMDYHPPMPAGS